MIVLFALGGCATSPLQRQSQPLQLLLAQADQHEQEGNTKQAIALVERIVRMEPRNAYAWHKLAQLYAAQGQLEKAAQFARRSNQLAVAERGLIEANQQIIDAADHADSQPSQPVAPR